MRTHPHVDAFRTGIDINKPYGGGPLYRKRLNANVRFHSTDLSDGLFKSYFIFSSFNYPLRKTLDGW